MIFKRISFITFFFIFILYNGLYGQTKIISTGDEWFYYDQESPLSEDWYSNKAIGSDWKKGPSPLGYGDSIVVTTISFGSDPESKHITKYFKKTFLVNDPYKHLIYKLNVQRDDGIVVYLNGQEVLRNNMPYGIITDKTTANGLVFNSDIETITHTKLLSPDDFIAGRNVISASVHQARKISSDCLFNLEIIGSDDPEMIPLLLKEQTIKSLNLDIKLIDLNHSQELEKKNLQLEFIEQSKNDMKTFFIIACTTLLLLILFLLYQWKNFTSNVKLLSKNIEELKSMNQNKDREMMNISLSSLHDKQFIKEIKRDLDESIKNTDNKNDITNTVRKIIQSIDYNVDSGEDWENLKKHFSAVHSGYVDKLQKLHPSLTEIELRHCIFIKLHMHTKEIANVLHIDPKSVQVSRYRIKKKMNLTENTDLKDYLMKM